jgi:hypothetical protein
MGSFKIESQITTTYVDPKSGDPIRGFEVTATLYPWDEFVRILVPSLKTEVVEPILDELVEQREALDKLGVALDQE